MSEEDLAPGTCATCLGSGEAPTEFGIADCPDCGGGGVLPSPSVQVDWRARDIERALQCGASVEPEHVKWLIAELRRARVALTEIIALAHDASEQDQFALRVRFSANRALGLYEMKPSKPQH